MDYLIIYKLIVLAVVILLMIVFRSPEMLQTPSKISFFIILVILICLWVKTGHHGYPNVDNMVPFIHFNWVTFMGNIFYSVEGISTIFTIRSSMERPTRMGNVSLDLIFF